MAHVPDALVRAMRTRADTPSIKSGRLTVKLVFGPTSVPLPTMTLFCVTVQSICLMLLAVVTFKISGVCMIHGLALVPPPPYTLAGSGATEIAPPSHTHGQMICELSSPGTQSIAATVTLYPVALPGSRPLTVKLVVVVEK